MKKVLLFLSLLIVGGCSYYKDTKVTITKEQQDNIAMQIVRFYDIQEIEFIQFTQDRMTGTLLLSLKINGDDSMKTTIRINSRDDLNAHEGWIRLNPLDTYEKFEKTEKISQDEYINLNILNIKYIGD